MKNPWTLAKGETLEQHYTSGAMLYPQPDNSAVVQIDWHQIIRMKNGKHRMTIEREHLKFDTSEAAETYLAKIGLQPNEAAAQGEALGGESAP